MALAKDIPCDAEMLETLRLALSKLTPQELEDYARSTPSFLSGGFRTFKTPLVRARLLSMLSSSEPVDPRLRAMLRDQIRRSLEAGGGNAAMQRELENARASLATLKGIDAKLAKESSVRTALELKVARLEGENAALKAERGALKQSLEKSDAALRGMERDLERQCDAALQTRLAREFAKFLSAEPAAETRGDTPAGRIAAAISSARDESLASWRICLDLLSSAGTFPDEERNALAIALKRRFAAIHAKGLDGADAAKDENRNSPRAILRRAIAGEIPAVALIDAHNTLFALQCRYRLPAEHRWPTAQARDWLVRDIAGILADVPNVRAYIVFDGPERSEATASANVQVVYSGGTGEHRADGVLVDQAKFLASAGAENILIFTNDGELAGLASRHGAKALPPTALLELL